MKELTREQIINNMLELDKAMYGICYEYLDEFGSRHRLDPTRVKKTVIEDSDTIHIHKPQFINAEPINTPRKSFTERLEEAIRKTEITRT